MKVTPKFKRLEMMPETKEEKLQGNICPICKRNFFNRDDFINHLLMELKQVRKDAENKIIEEIEKLIEKEEKTTLMTSKSIIDGSEIKWIR